MDTNPHNSTLPFLIRILQNHESSFLFPEAVRSLQQMVFRYVPEAGSLHVYNTGMMTDLLGYDAVPAWIDPLDLFYEEDLAAGREELNKLYTHVTGVPLYLECRFKHKTDLFRDVKFCGMPEPNAGNPARSYLFSVEDNTGKALQQYKKSLEEKIVELNRRNAELESFAYVASHDLQEPLRKLTAFSERLQIKFKQQLGTEGQLYLDRMAAAAENMRILIDDLLEFSRTARAEHHFSWQDLAVLFRAAQSDLEVKIEEAAVTIRTHALPVIDVIPVQIKRLFSNLLSNSIKFRKPDEALVITLSSERLSDQEKSHFALKPEKEYIRLLVEDNGIGFENEYAEKIFQLFQRLHGKHEYPGSGIGLAICKKIVENHDGLIYASGELNKGSLFTVILPEHQF